MLIAIYQLQSFKQIIDSMLNKIYSYLYYKMCALLTNSILWLPLYRKIILALCTSYDTIILLALS